MPSVPRPPTRATAPPYAEPLSAAGAAPTAPPTFEDVLRARRFLADHLAPTPLLRSDALRRALGLDVWLKCENLLPTGAFKVRGGLTLIGRDPSARGGVIAASTGNHGQSLAFAGRRFGVPVTIVVPREANPLKVASMRALGARILEHGADFDEARMECERIAATEGLRYVHSGNEPYLIAGVATASLEVLLERPDLDVLIVPVGGGSGAAGACLVAKTIAPRVRVVGVQAEGAQTAFRSWRERRLLEGGPIRTFAEGLATRVAFALPQRILWDHLDDFVLVSESELYRAMRLLLVEAHQVAEGAGAAATAAAWKLREDLAGRRVACWLSGGNATADSIARSLAVAD
ncbi:MAG: threonine ammonia-lyase [Candidatus Limnocylindria bacterium]